MALCVCVCVFVIDVLQVVAWARDRGWGVGACTMEPF